MARRRNMLWVLQIAAFVIYAVSMPGLADDAVAAPHEHMPVEHHHAENASLLNGLVTADMHHVQHHGMTQHGSCCSLIGGMCVVLLFSTPALPEIELGRVIELSALPSWSEAPIFSFPHPPERAV